MTKIASLTPKVPRGTIISEQTGGPPLSEAEHFWKCELCSGYFDMRDLGGAGAASGGRFRCSDLC